MQFVVGCIEPLRWRVNHASSGLLESTSQFTREQQKVLAYAH